MWVHTKPIYICWWELPGKRLRSSRKRTAPLFFRVILRRINLVREIFYMKRVGQCPYTFSPMILWMPIRCDIISFILQSVLYPLHIVLRHSAWRIHSTIFSLCSRDNLNSILRIPFKMADSMSRTRSFIARCMYKFFIDGTLKSYGVILEKTVEDLNTAHSLIGWSFSLQIGACYLICKYQTVQYFQIVTVPYFISRYVLRLITIRHTYHQPIRNI